MADRGCQPIALHRLLQFLWRTAGRLLVISIICNVSGTAEAPHATSVASTLLLFEFFDPMALIGAYIAR
jgi:hypothetical protein